MNINPNDEFIFIYALVPKSEAHKVKFPEGTFAKGLDSEIQEYLELDNCKRAGSMATHALHRLAKKLLPDQNKIELIKSLS